MAATKGTNSFESLSGANAYFLQGLKNVSWSAVNNTTRNQALVTAAAQINLMLKSTCQLPQEEADIPAALSSANAELALYYAEDPSRVNEAYSGDNIASLKAGSAEIKYFTKEIATRFPSYVMQLLTSTSCMGSSATIGDLSFVSGTCDGSSFLDPQTFPLNSGY